MSIHEPARHTFSSASSIVRLCNHTGYSDSVQDIIDKITYANITIRWQACLWLDKMV